MTGKAQVLDQALISRLAQRLKRLKARGVEFGEIELSVYARQLLSGPGRVTLAS